LVGDGVSNDIDAALLIGTKDGHTLRLGRPGKDRLRKVNVDGEVIGHGVIRGIITCASPGPGRLHRGLVNKITVGVPIAIEVFGKMGGLFLPPMVISIEVIK